MRNTNIEARNNQNVGNINDRNRKRHCHTASVFNFEHLDLDIRIFAAIGGFLSPNASPKWNVVLFGHCTK